MRITFVYPDFESLGVEYLMAVCRQAGHEVSLVFFLSGKSFYDLRKKPEASFENIAREIIATQPDLVAFSCVSDNYQIQLGCANAVKKIMPGIATIFGGFHPTAVPEIVLEEKAVDCVAIGEAEVSLPAFLKQCQIRNRLIFPEQKIAGMIFKTSAGLAGDVCEGLLPNLDVIPFPDKKSFHAVFSLRPLTYSIMTSRGCPYSCSYCFNSQLLKMRGRNLVRQRSIENVIAELKEAQNALRPKYIWFLDDCFTLREDWLLEFGRVYKNEIGLPFSCVTIPRYLNSAKIHALKQAGCWSVQMGVQSLSEELCRKTLLRPSENKKIAEAIDALREAGIFVSVDHMMGIPGDSVKNQEDSVLFYNNHRPNSINLFYLTYFPKTKITETAFEEKILTTDDVNLIERGVTPYNLRLDHPMANLNAYRGMDLLLRFLPFLPPRFVRRVVALKAYEKTFFSNRLGFVIFATFSRLLRLVCHRKDITLQQFFRLMVSGLISFKRIRTVRV